MTTLSGPVGVVFDFSAVVAPTSLSSRGAVLIRRLGGHAPDADEPVAEIPVA